MYNTTIGAQGEVDSAKFFIMTMFHNYDADNFYNKDILTNFWETCFVSAVSWDKAMRAESELTMTWTHSNEGSMMPALGNNGISNTSCFWIIFESRLYEHNPVLSLRISVWQAGPVLHGAPGNTVTSVRALLSASWCSHCHTESQLDLQPECQRWTGIYTQPAQLTG